MYGMSGYKVECLTCKNSCYDPEYGYSCQLELFEYMKNPNECQNYSIDADYLRKDLERFIKDHKEKMEFL